ncbi:MAG: hypothetical protein JWR48_7081 [Mycobacterium sp.]|nr:hypothetical protein [Mycobacterium sp.]
MVDVGDAAAFDVLLAAGETATATPGIPSDFMAAPILASSSSNAAASASAAAPVSAPAQHGAQRNQWSGDRAGRRHGSGAMMV